MQRMSNLHTCTCIVPQTLTQLAGADSNGPLAVNSQSDVAYNPEESASSNDLESVSESVASRLVDMLEAAYSAVASGVMPSEDDLIAEQVGSHSRAAAHGVPMVAAASNPSRHAHASIQAWAFHPTDVHPMLHVLSNTPRGLILMLACRTVAAACAVVKCG